jgi:hypothetical protein
MATLSGFKRKYSNKTSVAQRKEILRRHENGEKTSYIAVRFGLTSPGVSQILNREEKKKQKLSTEE